MQNMVGIVGLYRTLGDDGRDVTLSLRVAMVMNGWTSTAADQWSDRRLTHNNMDVSEKHPACNYCEPIVAVEDPFAVYRPIWYVRIGIVFRLRTIMNRGMWSNRL